MKPKFILSLLISFLLIQSVNAQWEIKNLNETSRYQGVIKFKNDSLGLFMGGNSTFLKSTDVGETWNLFQLKTKVVINDFQFVGDSSIFAVGNYYDANGKNISGKLIKSENLGESWDSIANIPGKQLLSLHFFDSDSGVVAGYDGIYRTTNGGISWDTVWSITQNGYKYGGLHQLNFPSTQTGYAIGQGRTLHNNPSFEEFLLKSTNAGLTWKVIDKFPQSLTTVYFIDEVVGFMGVGDGGIYKTSDGGNTWIEIPTDPYRRNSIKSIQFISEMKGFATGGVMNYLTSGGGGSNFSILKTIDGGETWASYDTLGIPLNSIWFLNDTTGFVSGDFELIMKTSGKMDELPENYPWHLIETSGIDEPGTSKSAINVYPNPTSGLLFINNNHSYKPIKSIRIINTSGQTIGIHNQISEKEFVQLNLSDQKPGIYFIKIGYSDKAEFVKIVKK